MNAVSALRPALLSALAATRLVAQQAPGEVSPDALFAGALPRIDLRLDPGALKALEKDPRDWVDFVLAEQGGATLKDCHIKLKGSAGSFRPITDPRPGFSIRTDKTQKKQEFRGLGKFQLNNCAQDGSMLLELLAGEMARKAGVPASRCTHAWVSLNGQALGPYVLKEGFNAEFLGYFFKDTKGHLYDGGFVADIRPDMEVDRGDPKDNRRLMELIGACQEQDSARRAERLNAVVDVDAYLRHLAMEQVLCHWDGYSFNRNNYRIYENRADGRFHFILHGMDQVFGDNRWYVFRRPGGLVPDALWSYPAIRARYREQFTQVYVRALRPVDWPKRALVVAEAVELRLRLISVEESKRFADRGRDASESIRRRLEHVRQQLDDASRLRRAGGAVALGSYHWTRSTDKDAKANEPDFDGRGTLRLGVDAEGGADWRLQLALPAGRYRITAGVRTKEVRADPAKGPGFRIRLSGQSESPALKSLTGTQTWRSVSADFIVAEEGEPTLVMELKAAGGEAWIDRSTISLIRLP
ncbi:MAG: hypothetical protein FJ410_06920 [Verrucomicrobia bacterium]|nr:hypothetical protein [Verrucomicrobiota bacterium]